ncbi:MAG: MATE family efflux transporter [Faecalibacterium sp.]|jgi:putative MATE family efflux protein|nr:MATE family efflux transporter [Faecalibacterium sp.]
MQVSHTQDMTTGSVTGHLIRFSLPLLAGNLFQQLYNMVDSIVVGNYVGANALAAVGACGSLNFLFFAMTSGVAIGVGILISQFFGAGDTAQVKRTIANSIYVLGVISVLVSAVGFCFARQILVFLSTPAEILADATIYLQTTCAGIVAVAAYNGISAVLRALGDSRTPLIFLILASVINVVLDLVFVLYFHAGVFGVALATIFAQAISAISCIFYACRRLPYFRLSPAERALDSGIIVRSLEIGTPVALQSSLIAISCLVLQSVVNGFGPTVVAVFTVTSRIEQLIQQPYSSLSTAVTTLTGQNIGAGKIERVRAGMRSATWITLAFSLGMLPVIWFFGGAIVAAFVKEPEVISMGITALRITSVCYFPLGMIYMPRALLNGAGDARFAMINGLTEVVCRIVFSNWLTHIAALGCWGIWITSGATWTVTACVCLARYFGGKWKTMRLVAARPADAAPQPPAERRT